MSTKREPQQPVPSVMARLMGLDERPPQQPAQKKPRVLSQSYLCRVASIGIREKCSESHSFNLNAEDQDEHENLLLETLRKKKQHSTPAQKREVHLGSLEIKMEVTEANHLSCDKKLGSSKENNEPVAIDSETINIKKSLQKQDLQFTKKFNQPNYVESGLQSGLVTVLKSSNASNSRDIGMCKKIRRRGEGGYENSLNEVQNSLGICSSREFFIDDMNKFSRLKFKINNRSFLPTSTIVVPKSNLGKADSTARSSFHYVSHPGNGKQNDIQSSCNGNLYAQVKRSKNLANVMGPVKRRSRFLWEKPKKVGNFIGSMASEEPGSKIRRSYLCAKESESTVPSSLILSNRKRQTYNTDGNVVREAKKQISERWKTTRRNFRTPGISSCNHWNHEFICDLPRPRSILESINLVKNKSREQDFDQKDDHSELGSSDSSFKKSQGIPYLELENTCSSGQKYQTSQGTWMKEGHKNEGWKGDLLGNQLESRNCILSTREEDSSCHIHDISVRQELSNEIFEEEPVSSPFSSTDPESLMSFEEAYRSSPNSVLEPFYRKEISSSSDCFKSVNASLDGLHMQLEILQSETSEAYSEGSSMMVSSDEDNREGSVNDSQEHGLMTSFMVEESRDFSYLVDVLTEAGFHNRNLHSEFDTCHSQELPISNSVFEILEKRYGEQISWKRSERRLLFDRINSGLMENLQLFTGVLTWTKPVARRFNFSRRHDLIEEELWMLLVNQEKEAINESEKFLGKGDGWLELGDDVQIISREIENSLFDELVAEVTMESF